MIPNAFNYYAPTTLGEAISLRKIAFECPARKGGDDKCVLPEAAAIR
jgi:hypothetical protein